MILHNDKDGAVDFTQGIEYFNTLRRMQKPVIMLDQEKDYFDVRGLEESFARLRPKDSGDPPRVRSSGISPGCRSGLGW